MSQEQAEAAKDVDSKEKSQYEKELEKYKDSDNTFKNPKSIASKKPLIPKSDTILLKMYPDYHNLSTEEQIFFLKITEGVFGYNEQIRNKALKVISTDYNIKFLAPYLCIFIKESIELNIVYSDLILLIYSVRMTKSLLSNPHVNLKEYLHDILPVILSCALAKKISKYYYDNHWTLRDFSAYVVAMISHMHSTKLNNVTQRVINIYLSAIKDITKPLTTVYGALKGIGSLGEEIIKIYLFPNIPFLSRRLYMILEKKIIYYEDKQSLLEAKHVRDVILQIIAPILLKTRNINDGGVSYIKEFGYLGRVLYIQVKNLEKIEIDKKQGILMNIPTLSLLNNNLSYNIPTMNTINYVPNISSVSNNFVHTNCYVSEVEKPQ